MVWHPKMDRLEAEGREEPQAYGIIVEAPGQDPILLESEGENASHDHLIAQARRMNATRYCVVRLVPESGNALLVKDYIRCRT